jgi:hypothetical protein
VGHTLRNEKTFALLNKKVPCHIIDLTKFNCHFRLCFPEPPFKVQNACPVRQTLNQGFTVLFSLTQILTTLNFLNITSKILIVTMFLFTVNI